MAGEGDEQRDPLIHQLWQRSGAASGAARREALNLERIVAAAIELADAAGLDAVSMSRVAERLGYTTMALYRHVRTKDDLLVLMVDAALRPPATTPDAPPTTWRSGLERWAWDVMSVLRRHPWILQIPITGPPGTPSQLAWLDRGLQPLTDTALTEQEKAAAVLLLNGHVFWGARLFTELDRSVADHDDAAGHPDAAPDWIASVLDSGQLPALQRALDAGIFRDESVHDDFSFGLDRILDGIDHLLDRRR